MKSYNNEKAIISLTSWKARINTVAKTIFGLMKRCPGFHIVLVLSEDEFPLKENELPEELILMQDYFEILWVKKNWKSFKKVLFTMDKYRDVPVISADDDFYYKYNYANELYDIWFSKRVTVSEMCVPCKYGFMTCGYATLFPPYCFGEYGLKFLTDDILECFEDDAYYAVLRQYLGIKNCFSLNKQIWRVAIEHDAVLPMRDEYNGKFQIHLEMINDIISKMQ